MPKPKAKTAVDHGDAADVKRLGVLRPSAPAVFIQQAVLDEILAYSEIDTSHEVGGFLIGGVVDRTPAGTAKQCVEVRHFLPARDTRGQAASLTFTHETWSTLRRQVEELHPQEKVVGWHHTHPGLGVFFSGYDRFIHRNFFVEPYHIALVVDPIRRELEFFQWVGDQIEDCGFLCKLDGKG